MDLEQAIDSFLLHLATERGLSTSYQLLVRRHLESFAVANAPGGLNAAIGSIFREDIEDHIGQRAASGLAPSSLRLLIVILRLFFRFCTARQWINRDPAERLETPRPTQRLPKTLSEAEVRRFLESITGTAPLALRDRAIAELLYSSGLRVAEVVSARSENLRLDEQFIRIVGKGSKTRVVPLGSAAREALERWFEQGRPSLQKPRSPSNIFLSRLGRPLTCERIRQILRERARDAGFTPHVHPHLFRHSFATHLLANDADLRVIQELLGHADISTTQIYTKVDEKHLRQIHQRFHPRA